MCVDLSRPIYEDPSTLGLNVGGSVVSQDEASHTELDEMELERLKASNFRDTSSLFDLEKEMKAINCERFIAQLEAVGLFQEVTVPFHLPLYPH